MEIRHTQNSFKSANGKTDICYYILEPMGIERKAVVQISHGMCEYFNRYVDFAKFLCKNGYVVCGNDHVGHGNSICNDSQLGFMANTKGFDVIVSDLQSMTKIVRRRYEDLPVFLLGHSMGSLIARCYIPRSTKKFAGIILSGTAGRHPLVKAGMSLSHSISLSKGPMFRSSMLKKMVFGAYNKTYSTKNNEYDWLSRDKAVTEKYLNDKRCNFTFTCAGFSDLFHLLYRANSKPYFKAFPKDLPVFLVAGCDDPVGDYGKGVQQVERNLKRNGVTDVKTILYPAARHEILNELNRTEVYADILSWLEEKLKTNDG